MTMPRLTIGRMMFAVALMAVPFALLQMTMNARSHFLNAINMGLWPSLVGFGAASFRLSERRGDGSPFLWGFTIAGWASVPLYIAAGNWCPWLIASPTLHFFNSVEPWLFAWLIDPDTSIGYMLNLLVLGLILSTPQFIMATIGGLVARDIGWKR